MELQLKNIGMIKEANVKIGGLTVIAGENDTGKSTVGKALFFLQEFQERFINKVDYKKIIKEESNYKQELEKLEAEVKNLTDNVDNLGELEFDSFSDISNVTTSMSKYTSKFSQLTKKTEQYVRRLDFIKKIQDKSDNELENLSQSVHLQNIRTQFKDFFYFELVDDTVFILRDESCEIGICENAVLDNNFNNLNKEIVIFIETPILANLYSFFSKLDTIQTDIEYKINDYPYTLRSLYKQLKLPLEKESSIDKISILKDIDNTIDGEISIGNSGDLIFKRDGNEHDILSVATGIKTFGIFQMLLKNNYLNKDTVLILDEPEVHLHPKWQLEMAKVIVELVKNSVKVLVNSHSPYMIEALERYSEKAEVTADFYLAEDGVIDKVENNNAKTLAKIFHKLSAPYETFNQMDSEILKGG